MAIPTLSEFRTLSMDVLLGKLLIKLSMNRLYSILESIKTMYEDLSIEEQREKFYFHIGRKLAAARDWDSMSFLQLEYEARVQGFLGPYQEHAYSEWDLRLMLACEARSLEEAQSTQVKMEGNEEGSNFSVDEGDEHHCKIILTKKNGVTMRF